MKKLFATVLSAAIALSVLPLGACHPKDGFAEYRKEEGFSYYRSMKLSEDKKLYAFNRSESLSSKQTIAAEAIQGIYARTNCKFYYYENGSYANWLEDLKTSYGVTVEDITFAEMVEMFKTDYNNKYVLYDGASNPQSLNCASTIAGALDCIPIDVTIEEEAKAMGLEKIEDATKMTEAKCFEKYKDMLNNDAIVQIDNTNHNDRMRDYGVACKYLHMWPKDMTDPAVMNSARTPSRGLKTIAPFTGGVPTTR